MKENLAKMLPPDHISWKLILDSARDGSTADIFDAAVKGKSRILVVVQSNTNFVFGAYVADTFGQPGGWISGCRETFLWTLRNNNTPLKLLYSGQGNSGHFSHCGLHLGDNRNELGAFCSYSCAAPRAFKLAPGYTAPVDSNLLAGSSSYTPTRIEVFELH